MNDARIERRLAAILAADVVGYSRLMAADEERTLARLTALRREVVDPAITESRGRVVNTTGDGLLAEFASVVDAVEAAMRMQQAVAAKQAELPAEERFAWRIGINVGDIMLQTGDIFGDGVNLAARLEALAEPGGILVSGAVVEQVRDKLSARFEDLGERTVKNMPRPVHIYRLVAGASPRGNMPSRSRGAAALVVAAVIVALAAAAWLGTNAVRKVASTRGGTPPPLSIAVLPFSNLSGDASQDWLADGITEDLITDLSRIANAFVIARNSSFAFKGKSVDTREAGKELGVRYVLQGSARREGGKARINAQLVDSNTGAQVWAERFDRQVEDIFALQNEITGRIARALQVQLLEDLSRKAARGPPANQTAEELAVRAWATLFNKPQTRETNDEAFGYLEQAVALDPNSSPAWAALSYAHSRAGVFSWSSNRQESLRRAIEAGERAVQLDPRSADAHYQLGFALRSAGQRRRSQAEMETCLQLNRNFAPCYHGIAFALVLDGRASEAHEWLAQAFKLSPRDGLLAVWHQLDAFASILQGDDESALRAARQAVAANPKYPTGHASLAVAAGNLGRIEEARSAINELRQLQSGATSVSAYVLTLGQSDNPTYLHQFKRFVEGLRKAGMPD